MIGIDTNALIDLFRGDKSLIELLGSLQEEIALNQVSYLEIMFGLNPKNLAHGLEEDYYDNLFNRFINLEISFNSCKKARDILWELKSQGKVTDQFDCIIAGILLSNGINKIITRNTKHFENIKGLKVVSY